MLARMINGPLLAAIHKSPPTTRRRNRCAGPGCAVASLPGVSGGMVGAPTPGDGRARVPRPIGAPIQVLAFRRRAQLNLWRARARPFAASPGAADRRHGPGPRCRAAAPDIGLARAPRCLHARAGPSARKHNSDINHIRLAARRLAVSGFLPLEGRIRLTSATAHLIRPQWGRRGPARRVRASANGQRPARRPRARRHLHKTIFSFGQIIVVRRMACHLHLPAAAGLAERQKARRRQAGRPLAARHLMSAPK